jgi:O-methyltransferase
VHDPARGEEIRTHGRYFDTAGKGRESDIVAPASAEMRRPRRHGMNGPKLRPKTFPRLYEFVWEALSRTQLRSYMYYKYRYMYSPGQLAFLIRCLDETSDVPGGVAEIGCAYGHTTVFLSQHLLRSSPEPRPYVAIDTFSGFTSSSKEVEARRGRSHPYGAFNRNDETWMRRTLSLNGCDWVKTIAADVESLDFSSLGPLSFCLVDVDLYAPVRASILGAIRQVQPGGILVVDDCDPTDKRWRGAYEAYVDCAEELAYPVTFEQSKLGIIRVARTGSQ